MWILLIYYIVFDVKYDHAYIFIFSFEFYNFTLFTIEKIINNWYLAEQNTYLINSINGTIENN